MGDKIYGIFATEQIAGRGHDDFTENVGKLRSDKNDSLKDLLRNSRQSC